MLIVHVHVQVNSESVGGVYRSYDRKCAEQHPESPVIARFDVVQQTDDPTRFVLVEVYRDEAATKAHKETAALCKMA